MGNLIRLVCAVLLGVLAAGANWMWISSQAKPPQFVAAKSRLETGRRIHEDDLVAVPVPGDLERLKKSLIPYRNRALLFGAAASRDYEAGDVFFQRDILPPREESAWDVIGPFRLISVGARFKEPDAATEAYASDSSRNNVTIEVSADFDAKTRRLLEVITPALGGTAKDAADTIVAVQVVPTRGRPDVVEATPDPTASSVYQTVSLEGITNVPRVLLAGDRIRFVIPGRREY
jgi:hypothetical protein